MKRYAEAVAAQIPSIAKKRVGPHVIRHTTILDLALAVYIAPNPNVSILLGNGDGTFHAGESYAAAAGVNSIAVGDFNGDGHLDLAVAGNDRFVTDAYND